MIRAKFRLPLTPFSLEIDLSLNAPVTVIVGPSGAGKTSLLETIAGLRRPAEGGIQIGDSLLFSSEANISLPPEQRRIGYVPQESLLFPHLDVKNNILYGAHRDASASLSLDTVVAVLELQPLLKRSVESISGGERQRVALARGLMTSPRMLLLDEPLAAVDRGLRNRILPYLRQVRDTFRIPLVYVTHDFADVFFLGDEVVLLEAGKVLDQGVPMELLGRKTFLRRLLEMPIENIFSAVIVENQPAAGISRIQTQHGLMLSIPCQNKPPRTAILVAIPAEDILVALESPAHLSAHNSFSGKIVQMEKEEGTVLLRVEAQESLFIRLTESAVERLHLQTEQTVVLIVKSHSVHIFP